MFKNIYIIFANFVEQIKTFDFKSFFNLICSTNYQTPNVKRIVLRQNKTNDVVYIDLRKELDNETIRLLFMDNSIYAGEVTICSIDLCYDSVDEEQRDYYDPTKIYNQIALWPTPYYINGVTYSSDVVMKTLTPSGYFDISRTAGEFITPSFEIEEAFYEDLDESTPFPLSIVEVFSDDLKILYSSSSISDPVPFYITDDFLNKDLFLTNIGSKNFPELTRLRLFGKGLKLKLTESSDTSAKSVEFTLDGYLNIKIRSSESDTVSVRDKDTIYLNFLSLGPKTILNIDSTEIGKMLGAIWGYFNINTAVYDENLNDKIKNVCEYRNGLPILTSKSYYPGYRQSFSYIDVISNDNTNENIQIYFGKEYDDNTLNILNDNSKAITIVSNYYYNLFEFDYQFENFRLIKIKHANNFSYNGNFMNNPTKKLDSLLITGVFGSATHISLIFNSLDFSYESFRYFVFQLTNVNPDKNSYNFKLKDLPSSNSGVSGHFYIQDKIPIFVKDEDNSNFVFVPYHAGYYENDILKINDELVVIDTNIFGSMEFDMLEPSQFVTPRPIFLGPNFSKDFAQIPFFEGNRYIFEDFFTKFGNYTKGDKVLVVFQWKNNNHAAQSQEEFLAIIKNYRDNFKMNLYKYDEITDPVFNTDSLNTGLSILPECYYSTMSSIITPNKSIVKFDQSGETEKNIYDNLNFKLVRKDYLEIDNLTSYTVSTKTDYILLDVPNFGYNFPQLTLFEYGKNDQAYVIPYDILSVSINNISDKIKLKKGYGLKISKEKTQIVEDTDLMILDPVYPGRKYTLYFPKNELINTIGINFAENTDKNQPNVALNLSIRFGQKVVVRTYRQNNNYGAEERSGGFPLNDFDDLKVDVILNEDYFSIYLNDVFFTNFTHKIPYILYCKNIISLDQIPTYIKENSVSNSIEEVNDTINNENYYIIKINDKNSFNFYLTLNLADYSNEFILMRNHYSYIRANAKIVTIPGNIPCSIKQNWARNTAGIALGEYTYISNSSSELNLTHYLTESSEFLIELKLPIIDVEEMNNYNFLIKQFESIINQIYYQLIIMISYN